MATQEKKEPSTKTAVGFPQCPFLRHCFTLRLYFYVSFSRIHCRWLLFYGGYCCCCWCHYRKIPNSLCFTMLRWNSRKRGKYVNGFDSIRMLCMCTTQGMCTIVSLVLCENEWAMRSACAYLIFGLSLTLALSQRFRHFMVPFLCSRFASISVGF